MEREKVIKLVSETLVKAGSTFTADKIEAYKNAIEPFGIEVFQQNCPKLVKFVDRTYNINPERYISIWKYILKIRKIYSYTFYPNSMM